MALQIRRAQMRQMVGGDEAMLLGALGSNATQPQGAMDLFGALQRDHAGAAAGNGLGDMLGGGARRSRASVGEQLIKSAASAVGREVGRQIIRGVLGSILGGSKR